METVKLNTLVEKAIQCQRAGHLREAITLYQQILAHNPYQADALHGMGLIQKQAGNHNKALQLIERAIEQDSNRPEFYTNLGGIQRTLGLQTEALQSFNHAVSLAPDNPMIRVNLGLALQNHDRTAAVSEYRLAIKSDSSCAPAFECMGHALMTIDHVAAKDAFIKALKISPDLRSAQERLRILLFNTGENDNALENANHWLARFPGDITAIADKAIAYYEMNRDEDGDYLVNHQVFQNSFMIDTPHGYDSMEAFNEAIEHHVRNHPALYECFSGHATKNGRRVDNILAEPKGPIKELEKAIFIHTREYIASLPNDLKHDYLKLNPPKFDRMHAWAVLMHNQGYETQHIHPSGRISGVYYVSIPKIVSDPTNVGHEGWIEFGDPDPAYLIKSQPKINRLMPEPGLMVLFPSYFWHHTIPFSSKQDRLCIAFDIVS